MKLKSLLRPRRGLAAVATAGAVTLGIAGFAVVNAGTASADPAQVYTTVGSDTTQDVVNGFAHDLGSNELGSWNAVNPVTQVGGEIITPANLAGGQCSFTRPNGSTQGLSALRKSINPNTTAPQLASPPQPNCVDFSRSSSGPGTNQSNTGALVYVPFALDAVGGSVGSESTATFQTDTNAFTEANLVTLFTNCASVIVNGTTYNPGTGGNITLYIPQSGSGTLSFWATTLGFSSTSPPACDHQTIQAGPNAGQMVEEHDGTAVTSDSQGYGPFSIAQWVSQRNGHNDRRHLAILRNVNGVFPCSGNSNCSAAGTSLNPSFPITRDVYNVVLYTAVTGGNAAITQLLGGSNSLLCQDIFTIAGYGFAQVPNNGCGSTAAANRAFDPATNPI